MYKTRTIRVYDVVVVGGGGSVGFVGVVDVVSCFLVFVIRIVVCVFLLRCVLLLVLLFCVVGWGVCASCVLLCCCVGRLFCDVVVCVIVAIAVTNFQHKQQHQPVQHQKRYNVLKANTTTQNQRGCCVWCVSCRLCFGYC